MKLVYFYLKNFIFLNNLGLTELEFSRYDSNNNIILILGRNGAGKSSLLSEITPLPIENTNNRSTSRVVQNKEGKKILEFLDDVNNIIYRCNIEYGKKTSCFFSKKGINDTEFVELNSNGNVGSYIELVKNELGMDKDYAKVGHLSSVMTNFINMKPYERNNYISTWLPNISEYVEGFKVVQKKYNQKNKEVKSLDLELGKIESIDYEININEIKEAIDEINAKNDKIKSDITTCESHFNLLGTKLSECNKLEKYKIKHFKTHEMLSNMKSELLLRGNDFIKYHDEKVLKNSIKTLKNDKNSHEKTYGIIRSRINKLKEDIKIKSSNMDDINIKLSLEDADKMIDYKRNEYSKYEEEYNTYEKSNKFLLDKIGIININLFYEVNQVCNFIVNMIDRSKLSFDNEIDTMAKMTITLDDYIKDFEDTKNNLKKYNNQRDCFISERTILNDNKHLKDVVETRPKEKICAPSTCSIVKYLEKYVDYEKELTLIESNIDSLDILISNNEQTQDILLDKINNLRGVLDVITEINNYIMNSKSTISTFPIYFVNLLSDSEVFSMIRKLREVQPRLESYKQLLIIEGKKEEIYKDILELENIKNTIIIKSDLESEVKEYNLLKNNLEDIIKEINDLDVEIEKLEHLDIKKKEYQDDINEYNLKVKLFEEEKEYINTLAHVFYLYKTNRDCLIKLNSDKMVFDKRIKELNDKRELLKTAFINKTQLENIRNNNLKIMEKYKVLMSIWDTRTGYPSLEISDFLYKLKSETNKDLNELWFNNLSISDFIINSNEFSINVDVNGTIVDDASGCSESERSTLAIGISMAIIQMNLENRKYNIIKLDECNAGYDDVRKNGFISMIMNKVDQMGSEAYIITHDISFNNVNADVIMLDDVDKYRDIIQNKNILYHL